MHRRIAVRPRRALAAFALLSALIATPAAAATICTVTAEAATGRIVLEQGDCGQRVTPASTFKIALAVIGFDAGILVDAHTPTLPFRDGYPDWGGDAWRRPTDPAAWMKHSVVWYSQRIAEALGEDRFGAYLARLGYGNEDGSGDPGRGNALERSWISSSLKISPREQLGFLAGLVRRDLPISAEAMAKATSIVETFPVADGWTVHGKTGSAYPRKADGSFDRARGWGWFVGWAERDGETLVFARLTQDETRHSVPAGLRTRDGLLGDFPSLAGQAAR